MPNHVHLILVPSDPDGLLRAPGRVHRHSAGVIHARRKRSGHFWEGWFGAVAMDEEHLAAALRHVSLNHIDRLSSGGSESFRQASLFQDGVGGVARRNGIVDHEAPFGDWAFPNLVIALALADKLTPCQAQDFLQFRSEAFFSRDGAYLRDNLDRRNGFASEQVLDHAGQLGLERFKRCSPGCQPETIGQIGALGNPFAGLVIPCRTDGNGFHWFPALVCEI
jgi:hypothetical protein